MRFAATLACLLACGCTRANSDYITDSGVGGDNDFGLEDLGATAGTPCSGEARTCLGTASSGFCRGGVLVLDRTCPSQSSCVATYCAPPPHVLTQIGERCDIGGDPRDGRCLANLAERLTCQPFVSGGKELAWYCDRAVGSGGGGNPCSRATDCRSGVCADTGFCFAGCRDDFDCPARPLHCISVHVTVEGVTETAKSCGL
jgi:hypothetical protein